MPGISRYEFTPVSRSLSLAARLPNLRQRITQRNESHFLLTFSDPAFCWPVNVQSDQPENTTMSSNPTTPAQNPTTPLKTFKFGRIKAAVWENEVDRQKYYNVTFARTY